MHHRQITIMRSQLEVAIAIGDRAAELVLRSRLAPRCQTPGCQRERQRDSGFCPTCLGTVWTTGSEPMRLAS
jgi:hypothetical protein